MTYHLLKYSGPASRLTCPRCGHAHCFTPFVDEAGVLLSPEVGFCSRLTKCGYRYTPAEFKRDGGSVTGSTAFVSLPSNPVPDFIDFSYVSRSESPRNRFIDFFQGKVAPDVLDRVVKAYHIGSTRDHCTIWWQIDQQGRVRTGKIMRYDPCCHRDHSYGADWVHSRMMRQGLLDKQFNMIQCLFGEHLLRQNYAKWVVLVESEKTAVLGAMMNDSYHWLATGGLTNLTKERIASLSGRRVLLLPDRDAYGRWMKKLPLLKSVAREVELSRFILSEAREEDAHIDFGDYILHHILHPFGEPEEPYVMSPQLASTCKQYPVLQHLAEAFQLE